MDVNQRAACAVLLFFSLHYLKHYFCAETKACSEDLGTFSDRQLFLAVGAFFVGFLGFIGEH